MSDQMSDAKLPVSGSSPANLSEPLEYLKKRKRKPTTAKFTTAAIGMGKRSRRVTLQSTWHKTAIRMTCDIHRDSEKSRPILTIATRVMHSSRISAMSSCHHLKRGDGCADAAAGEKSRASANEKPGIAEFIAQAPRLAFPNNRQQQPFCQIPRNSRSKHLRTWQQAAPTFPIHAGAVLRNRH